MRKDIFIIGRGQTKFGELWDMSLRDLMQAAVDEAIENAPCNVLDIDMIVVANMLGETVSNQAHLGAMASGLLPHQPPALRTEAACASGTVAMHTACSLLECGKAKNILVVGTEKMTDASTEEISAALMGAGDAEKDGDVGLTFPGIFGLVTTRYMYEYGLTRDDLSVVSSVHHKHAVANPNAQFRREVSPEQVTASTLVSDPLRLLDCSPISDGAAACILSTEHQSNIRLAASQLGNDALSLADRPTLTSFAATRDAMENALNEAEVERTDISHIELHDCFSIAAVIHLEDMGFAEPGRGIELYKKESPELSINASGGLKACGHPVGATGVKQITDLCKQLEQSENEWAVAHNIGGVGATCGIHILQHTAS